jgi:hypothetical protein
MMMTRLAHITLALYLALITAACGASMKKLELKQNPNPKQRYDVTMSIQDAPGPFDSISGYGEYTVSNNVCVPLEPGSGARLTPGITVPFELTRSGDAYKGYFYADQMVNEDYFGLGVCKWELIISSIKLKVRTNTFDAPFYFSHDEEKKINVMPAKSLTLYFLSSIYTDQNVQNFIHDGTSKRAEYQQFSVTIKTKENFK